jgi:hypothetical protein
MIYIQVKYLQKIDEIRMEKGVHSDHLQTGMNSEQD